MSEAEWSQNKKLIDFGARRGGFRRAMVPNLPYFMVQFDYKGEKGYGHVIEGTGEAADAGDADGAIDASRRDHMSASMARRLPPRPHGLVAGAYCLVRSLA